MTRPAKDAGALPARRMEVLGVRAGFTYEVILLDQVSEIPGLLYHWKGPRKGGRPYYCPPEGGCDKDLHKLPATWHGYLSVLVWKPQEKLWIHAALEITSSCELDMRGRIKRGQLWRVSRKQDRTRVKPVTAELLKDTVDVDLPPAENVIPTVASCYGLATVTLNTPSPFAARQLLPVVKFEEPPPEAVTEPTDQPEYVNLGDRLRAAGWPLGAKRAAAATNGERGSTDHE